MHFENVHAYTYSLDGIAYFALAVSYALQILMTLTKVIGRAFSLEDSFTQVQYFRLSVSVEF